MKQIFILAILLPVLNSCAQNSTGKKPLNVGDTIPPIILTDVINFPVSQIQLNNNNSKLVVLDFWATWCGSCIKKLSFIDSVQKAFKENIQIILVNSITGTGDSKEAVINFYKKRILSKYPSFAPPIVMGDTLLRSLFPHEFVPHYVWINPAGKVIAFTSSIDFTSQNIIAALNGNNISTNTSEHVIEATH